MASGARCRRSGTRPPPGCDHDNVPKCVASRVEHLARPHRICTALPQDAVRTGDRSWRSRPTLPPAPMMSTDRALAVGVRGKRDDMRVVDGYRRAAPAPVPDRRCRDRPSARATHVATSSVPLSHSRCIMGPRRVRPRRRSDATGPRPVFLRRWTSNQLRACALAVERFRGARGSSPPLLVGDGHSVPSAATASAADLPSPGRSPMTVARGQGP